MRRQTCTLNYGEELPLGTWESIIGSTGHRDRVFVELEEKIGRPVARQVDSADAQHFTSDCPMAAEHIAGIAQDAVPTHPLQLLRKGYGI